MEENREQIEKQEYWKYEVDFKLGLAAKHALHAGSRQQCKTTKNLNLVLSGLGVPRREVENIGFGVPEKEYWDIEFELLKKFKNEMQESNQSTEDLQAASPTHT
ncbi:hypothetical protein CLAIMM_15097 [Cladophialophora immunda]|nr:hypothetical protein CLAIMM_15097 [Cladophialophora immunda]